MMWLLCVLTFASAMAVNAESGISGNELWGMRPRHVAVVNPVLEQDPSTVISLCGAWEALPMKYRPSRNCFWQRVQDDADWSCWGKVRQLMIPGSAEVQGVGEPGLSRPWDCWWDSAKWPLTHVHEGCVWYRRNADMPASWRGRRIWLKIGGVSEQAWFWVNGTQVALPGMRPIAERSNTRSPIS